MKVKLLDARDVVGVASVEVAAGPLLVVERREDPRAGDRFVGEAHPFFVRAVAPDDSLGLGELRHIRDPGLERRVFGERLVDRKKVAAALS
jgi:hypothetical protein